MKRENLIETELKLPLIQLNVPATPSAYPRESFEGHFIKKLLEGLKQSDSSESLFHLEMVGRLSEFLCEKLGKSPRETSEIGLFARLHDIGKIGIPREILNKRGRLTSQEFDVMKKHTDIGYYLLEGLKVSQEGLEIIKYHHEKWDGTGYYGLEEESIPQSARIVAIADVYDALRMERPYKNAFTHEEALEIILGDRGTHFDPEITDIFSQYEEEIENMYEAINVYTKADKNGKSVA